MKQVCGEVWIQCCQTVLRGLLEPCPPLDLQMTASQSESWSANMNQFVADEEDEIFTTRVSGELLLDELHQVSARRCGRGDDLPLGPDCPLKD